MDTAVSRHSGLTESQSAALSVRIHPKSIVIKLPCRELRLLIGKLAFLRKDLIVRCLMQLLSSNFSYLGSRFASIRAELSPMDATTPEVPLSPIIGYGVPGGGSCGLSSGACQNLVRVSKKRACRCQRSGDLAAQAYLKVANSMLLGCRFRARSSSWL